MIDKNFTLVSGTYADEQGLLSELDFFMVNTVGGWVREKVVTDIATDKNIAYYNDGTISGTDVYDRFWLRIRATEDELRFTGLSYFNSATDADSDNVHADNLTELSVVSSGIYWFAANTDAVHVLIERADGLPLHGGFGYFNTYFTPEEDPKPFYVFGQYALNMTFASDLRLYAYGPHSWGSSYSTTQSGIERGYGASHPTQVTYGTPNPRSGYPKLIEPVFVTEDIFGTNEARGEVPGLYMCGGTGLTPGALIEIKYMAPTTSGMYLIHKHSDANAWAIGPVTVSGEG
jgi:hypothetical protein